MGVSFDSRGATLAHAGRAGDLANALACGLVYVGDQIGRLADAAQNSAVKSVKVVTLTPRTVLLECDGKQHQLFAGDTLPVEVLREVPREVVVRAVAPGLLEVDGVRHELALGDSLSIPTGVKGS